MEQCNFFRGKCLYLNSNKNSCRYCPVKRAYNKGKKDMKKQIKENKE